MEPSTTQMPFMPHWITGFKDVGYENVIVGTVEGYPEIDQVLKQLRKMAGQKKW